MSEEQAKRIAALEAEAVAVGGVLGAIVRDLEHTGHAEMAARVRTRAEAAAYLVPLSAELILDVRERPRLRDYAERLERELAEQRAEAADSDEKLARASERLRRVGAKRSRLHAVLQAVRDDAYELGEECDEHNGRVGELPACPCCALALKIDSALRGEADTSPTELLDELQAPGAEARIADRLGFGGTGG